MTISAEKSRNQKKANYRKRRLFIKAEERPFMYLNSALKSFNLVKTLTGERLGLAHGSMAAARINNQLAEALGTLKADLEIACHPFDQDYIAQAYAARINSLYEQNVIAAKTTEKLKRTNEQ